MTEIVSHASLCNSVKDTLKADATLAIVEHFYSMGEDNPDEQLPDAIPVGDTPVIWVTWEGTDPDDLATEPKQTTFGAAIRRTRVDLFADVVIQQRNFLGQDLKAVCDVGDLVYNAFEAQKIKPFFGEPLIQEIAWTAERFSMEFGDPKVVYVGMRFALKLWIY